MKRAIQATSWTSIEATPRAKARFAECRTPSPATRPHPRAMNGAQANASRAMASFPLPGLLLEEPLGPLRLALPLGRQVLAGAGDEELGHADPRADALGADLLAGHRAGDRLGVLGGQALRQEGRNRLHVADPPLLLRHDCLPRGQRSEVRSQPGEEHRTPTSDSLTSDLWGGAAGLLDPDG